MGRSIFLNLLKPGKSWASPRKSSHSSVSVFIFFPHRFETWSFVYLECKEHRREAPVGSTVAPVSAGKERKQHPSKATPRRRALIGLSSVTLRDDSERHSEPFYGSGLGNQQKIPHFKGANTTKSWQLRRKEIWFHVFLKKEKKKSNFKRI